MHADTLSRVAMRLAEYGVPSAYFSAMLRSAGGSDCELHDRSNNLVVAVKWLRGAPVVAVRQMVPLGSGCADLQRDLDVILSS